MKKFLKRFFIILLSLFSVCVIAGTVFIYRFDLNAYKSRMEKTVFNLTGRKLSLDGDIRLKISWSPTLSIKRVSFADADWSGRKSMIKVKEAEISVAIIPLFDKVITIDDIKLIQPEIYLSVNDKGKKNWAFEKNASKPEKKNPETDGGFMSGIKSDVKKISISDGVIIYDSPTSKVNLQIKQASLRPEKNRVFLDYDLLYNDLEVKGTMKGDALASLIKQETYNAEIDVAALKCRLKASVALTDLSGGWHTEGKLDLTSPDGNFNLPALHLKSNVRADQKKVSLLIEQLEFGKSVMNGDVNVSFLKKPDIRAKITGSLIDIPSLIPVKKDVEKNASSTSDALNGDFIAAGDLNLEFLNQFDTRFVFDISRLLVSRDLILDKLKGTAEVKDGVLSLKGVSFVAGKGTVKGDLLLKAKENAININVDGRDVILSDLIKSLQSNEKGFSFKKGGVAYMRVALKTKGKSYRDLFENLDGRILLTVGRSEVQFGLLKYVRGNFLTQLISALNISTKQADADLKCAVIRADFAKGIVQFPKGLVFDSDQIKLVADGSVNLADNNLDIRIQPLNGDLMQTNATQILASMIKITGTVMKPSVSVDSKSVVKNAAGIAAGGAIFIGTKLLLDSDADPCHTALQGTAYSEMYKKTGGIKAGMQRAYQKTSDTLEQAAKSVIDTTYESGKKAKHAVDNTIKNGVDTFNKTANRFLNRFGDKE